MPIFSDEVHDWAGHTYEVFVPARARSWLHQRTTDLLTQETAAGEFFLTVRRWTNEVLYASFVPAREPQMQYDVPLEILTDVLGAASVESAEDKLTYAGQHPVLIDDFDYEEGSDDE